MLFAFFLSLFAVSSVFASHSSVSPAIACAQQLEGVVFAPKNCARNYLKSINKVLKAQSPLLWGTPFQAQSVIQSFERTYGVIVKVVDAFGYVYNYPGAAPLDSTPSIKSHLYAVTEAQGEGFSANVVLPTAITTVVSNVYASLYWNLDGQMYTVAIIMDNRNVPSFC